MATSAYSPLAHIPSESVNYALGATATNVSQK